MQKKKLIPLIVLLFSFILFSCAVVPTTKVWQPWTRSFEKPGTVLTEGATVWINVTGENTALIGENSLLHREMTDILSDMLDRKGLKIQESVASYNFLLQYRTERHDKNETSVYANSQSSANSSSSNSFGFLIAALISSSQSSAYGSAEAKSVNVESYTHIISLEIDNGKEIIYKGESYWDSSSPDIRGVLRSALQILVNNLGLENKNIPRVPKVKSDYVDNYFINQIKGQWFASPALPYKTIFADYSYYKYSSPKNIKDPFAYEAYVDLLETAEFALPTGSNDYSNPVEMSLWKTVQLSGCYYLGRDENPSYIIINLKGTSSGYTVDNCKTVTKDEYKIFEEKMRNWKKALNHFFNYYE